MSDAEEGLRAALGSLEDGLDVLIDRESDGDWPSLLGGPPERVLDLDARLELARLLDLPPRLGFTSTKDFERWSTELTQARAAVVEGRTLRHALGDDRPVDALLGELRAVADRAWGLARSEASLLEAFERSRIALAVEPGGELIGAEAVAVLPVQPPAFVITAENPGGVRAPGADNDRWTAELETLLREGGVSPREVVAGSGPWRERGYLVAVAQLRPEDVLAVAARFRQHSVFRLTAETVEIVRVADGATISCRPRHR